MNKTFTNENSGSRFCKEFVEIVQLILDDEAKDEDIKLFKEYYMKCKDCIKYYDIEESTISFIKQKIKRHTTPVDFEVGILDSLQIQG